jgi:hypothetical protein
MGAKLEVGMKFNRLTVLKKDEKSKYWVCRCDCGTEKSVRGDDIYTGSTKSCGCFLVEEVTKRMTKHGLRFEPEYQTWIRMKTRCNNPNSTQYPDYGARGIQIEWETFGQFYKDMGKKPSSKHSLDRIDVNGNYSKENCKWSTSREQANNKRNTPRFTLKSGEIVTMRDLIERTGINRNTLWSRIKKKGMSADDAISKPILPRAKRDTVIEEHLHKSDSKPV